MRERERYRIMKKFSKFLDDESIEDRNETCVWDAVRFTVNIKNAFDMEVDPCFYLCEKIFPETINEDCPCKVFGVLQARKKLNRYLSDYEAKHKKGGKKC